MKRFLMTCIVFVALFPTTVCAAILYDGVIEPDPWDSGSLDICIGETLLITNGSAVNTIYSDMLGTVAVDGNGSTWSLGSFINVGPGTLSITNGGAVICGSYGCVSDIYDEGIGAVTIDGTGSTWTISRELWVNGMLSIKNGGAVSNKNYCSIGYTTDMSQTGVVTVDGNGSKWNNSSDLFDGGENGYFEGSYYENPGNGTLSISNGGAVSNNNGYIGCGGSDSIGKATVDGAGSTWTNNGDLIVGGDGCGTLSITKGGAVSNNYGWIGYASGSTGTVTVDGTDSSWTNNGYLSVGNSGDGTLSISNGGTVSNYSVYIGFYSGSTGTVTVDGTGSTWTNHGDLYIGKSGEGSLSITGGGNVGNYNGYIGYASGSTGSVTVDGTGSTWTNNGDLYIGYSGNGTISISDGGTVINNKSWIGYASGSTGIVTVDGTGSNWTSSIITIGYSGNGALTVGNGGVVTGDIYIAQSGLLSVSGGTIKGGIYIDRNCNLGSTGMIISDDNLICNSLTIGYVGYGSLNITNGNKLNSSCVSYIGYAGGSSGGVTVDGEDSTWISNGDLYVGCYGGGTLSITNGGTFRNNNGCIGYGSGSTGSVTVDGNDSSWSNSGDLYIGNSGAGTLSITKSGTVGNNNGWIGYGSGSTGMVTVDGADSTWTNNGDLYVGKSGSGTLSISKLGAVRNNKAWIGYASGSIGIVTVSGNDSTWTNNGDLYVGNSGAGSLSIAGGGAVDNNNGYIGYASGSIGIVTVSGADSTWSNGGDLYVGYCGAGSLSIGAGGTVGKNNGCIGYANGSIGLVTVSGNDSNWSNNGDLYVGYCGAGSLSISKGGFVGNNNGYIGFYNGSTGKVTVDGADSTWTNSGDLYVGKSGSGSLSITNGGAVTAAGVTIYSGYSGSVTSLLAIDIGRDSSLVVGGGTGTITNNGTILIFAGAKISAGDTYSPIYAGNWIGSGTYEAIGGTWDASNHQFTVSNVQEGTAGTTVSIDPATTQRMHVSDSGTHQSAGLSFLSASVSKQINVVAAPMSGTSLTTLQGSLGSGESVLSAWNFSVTGNGYTTGDTAFLSLQTANQNALKRYFQVQHVWQYDSQNSSNPWSITEPPEMPSSNFGIFGPGDYIDFSVTHFSGYAVTGVRVPAPGAIDWQGGNSASTNWKVAANWNPDAAVPSGPGTNVNFGNQPAANNVVDMISQEQTVGTITFFANTSTTIQSSGGFALTLDNNGSVSTIDVDGTHTISAPVILNNDAIIVGTGTLDLSGGITGSHDLEVDINLTATSIQVDTLTIDPGATLTIQAIPDGPLGSAITAVPEPSTLILLGVGAVGLFICARQRRQLTITI